ncbi:putative transmembrane protein [Apostichopus japonicus]|uniref:Putative transmembrane protein n=1 Tax=Stichopus japonicus TaxID=307972 RepID=A0A2G8KZM0_STIJA|nr:putative transmembrane protein [Apostichopus japonicus]PIK53473.1 putative transmembrane protein [Apostichopus japonicus]
MATKLMQRLNKNCVNLSWFANNRTIGTNGSSWGITICRPSNNAEGRNKTAILFGSVKSYFSYPQICGCTATGNTVHRGRDRRAQQGRAYSTSAESSTKLIYSGPLTSVVRGVKFFSLSTTIMSGTLVPLLLRFGDSGVMTTIGLSFATVMIATPILLHWFSRSYVTRLYLDGRGDGYVAKTMTFILREKTHKFKATDVAIPSVRNVFTTFVANGRPFLVDPRGFFDPNQFSQLMGQDEISQEELEKMMKNMKDDED